MSAKTIKTLLSVALLGACLLSMGCDEDDWFGYGYGCCDRYHEDDWTDIGVGVGFWPAYEGYTVVEEYPVVTDYYYDGGGYYYDDGYGDYYDDWKTKRAGRSK